MNFLRVPCGLTIIIIIIQKFLIGKWRFTIKSEKTQQLKIIIYMIYLKFRIKGYDGIFPSKTIAAVNALIAATKFPLL